jgi:hypothetical protein
MVKEPILQRLRGPIFIEKKEEVWNLTDPFPSITFKVGITSKLIAQPFGMLRFESRRLHSDFGIQLMNQRLHAFPSAGNKSK